MTIFEAQSETTARSGGVDVGITLILVGILLVAAFLRFTGLDWDEGQWIHPDEGHMRMILSVIELPEDPALYFDTANSPLNCRNRGHQYSYGTLPLFLTRATAEWLDQGCGPDPNPLSLGAATLLTGSREAACGRGAFTGSRSALVGRLLAALADLGTVGLVYLIGRRLYGQGVGLLGAGLYTLTGFAIQQAHFFTVDSVACFLTTLTAYFAVRAAQSGGWVSFALAGVTTGLATASKVSAVFIALFVALAGAQWLLSRPGRPKRDDWVYVALCLVLAGLLAAIAFRVGQPYAFEGPGFFGVRPAEAWFGRLSQIAAEQGGEIDYPSGRQWTNRTPLVFPWVNIVVWGMGLPLGLAAWAGWAVAGVALLRKDYRHLAPWVWVTLIFAYQGTRWVKAMRYFLALYPFLILFAAYLLWRLFNALSRRRRRLGVGLAALVVLGSAFWALAVFSIYLRPHPRLAASRWIYEHVPAGSTVANEHWDWGLPLRIDGQDPFGGLYRGIEMTHYDEDTLEKRQKLYEWLDEADYIFLASNRLYASIPRLPARYPLTTAYYRALFAGQLGFELAADFTSYPALGPFVFPDQENPFPLISAEYEAQPAPIEVPLPPAEESFSVYDHPRVLIFRKTDAYSRALVEQALGPVDVVHAAHGLKPIEATRGRRDLTFSPEVWEDQQAGGTWSRMFDREGLLNRYPGLAALAWWAAVTVLGWLVFPLLFVALPKLSDRGYGVARTLALLALAYLTWLAASLRMLPHTRGTITRMALLLALIGGGVGWFRREALRRFVRRRWRLLVGYEVLFAVLYGLWVFVRMLNPDLWHTVVGGEKPMDFAYLNAVLKSTWFPPYNPWLSGTYINYYYFGFVLVGSLIKLLGTMPAIGYNLAVPLLFALTGLGAFSAAYNLFGGYRRGGLLAGLLGLTFTLLIGNLGVVRLIYVKLVELGGPSFPSTIPGFPEVVAMFQGLWQVLVKGASLPMRPESWYWSPTRIIPIAPGEVGPITEFPAFTFLYADLHAHMMALPLALTALVLAVSWLRRRRPSWLSILLGGLVIGALYPTNTWDYPTYLFLGLVGLALGAWRGRRRPPLERWLRAVGGRALVLIGLSLVLYVPYIRRYVGGYTSFGLWEGSRTPLTIYLWIHGIVLFPLLTRLLIELRAWWRRSEDGGKRLPLLATFIMVLLGSLLLYFLGYEVALLVIPLGSLILLRLIAPHTPVSRRFLWLMVGVGLTLTLVVELIVLRGDIGRMNTVFKFYLQVWLLLSTAAAVSAAWVWARARFWPAEWRELWWIVMVALLFAGALFLPFGVRARAVDRMTPGVGLTLDGMAFMEGGVIFEGPPDSGGQEIALWGDYAAIRWLQDTVPGSPVILEGLGYREYLWGNRVSIYTGLPAVVGWRWHQVQQRAGLADAEVDRRQNDVRTFYNTSHVAEAEAILERYGVRYVYVGDYERAYYNAVGLAKLNSMVNMGVLRVAYDAQGVTIYEVLL